MTKLFSGIFVFCALVMAMILLQLFGQYSYVGFDNVYAISNHYPPSALTYFGNLIYRGTCCAMSLGIILSSLISLYKCCQVCGFFRAIFNLIFSIVIVYFFLPSFLLSFHSITTHYYPSLYLIFFGP